MRKKTEAERIDDLLAVVKQQYKVIKEINAKLKLQERILASQHERIKSLEDIQESRRLSMMTIPYLRTQKTFEDD